MDKRPDYIKCIAHNMHREDSDKYSWCGRKILIFEFHFLDIDHAALNGENKGRLVACPECVAAIISGLTNGE